MAAKRGRTLNSFGAFLTPIGVDATSNVVGQPTMTRTWGIPTGPGWLDRPGKWNVLLPPLIAGALELMRRILNQVRV